MLPNKNPENISITKPSNNLNKNLYIILENVDVEFIIENKKMSLKCT